MRSVLFSAAILLLLACSPNVQAASYDPDLKWRTIRTEHFDIHFHQGLEKIADDMTLVVEKAFLKMSEEMQWTPRGRIQLTLVDRTDDANGYASTLPYNQITLFVTAPTGDSTLGFYEDWNDGLFTHELTHILHLDTHRGVVSGIRAVFGRIISTNSLSPWWMVEGMATFQETRHTPAGRGRGAVADMIKRTHMLAEPFPELSKLGGVDPAWPGGNRRYLFGQDFMQFIAEHQGENAWTRWSHTYGGSVPYLLPGKRVFKKRISKLYKEWRTDRVAHYTAMANEVREEGVTHSRMVSLGDVSCTAPSFSPDGDKLVWTCYDLKTGSSIWMSDGEGYAPEKLLQDRGATGFTWRSDSKAFVYAGSHLVNRFNIFSDIYLHRLGGSTTALTGGARARDPEFSPDGSRLLYVTNKAQVNNLEVMTVDQQRQSLTHETEHVQFGTPRYSPSGEVIAVSVWRDGARDLWLYSKDGEPIRRLTSDTALETDPRWSADGKWLYFVSDRSKIPNVYAIETNTERLFQITNVVTGAMKVSVHPDNTRIAYQQYSADGWDIRVLDLDRDSFIERGRLPHSFRYNTALSDLSLKPKANNNPIDVAVWDDVSTPFSPKKSGLRPEFQLAQSPSESLDSFDTAEEVDVFGEEQEYPFRITPSRYNPLKSLLPRYIAPYILSTPFRPGPHFQGTCVDERWLCTGFAGSLNTGASDALSRYAWGANLNYRTDAEYLGGSASFLVNRWLPIYSAGVSTNAVPSGRIYFVDPAAPVDQNGAPALLTTDPVTIYWEARTQAFAQVSWPYRLRTSLFARYSFTERKSRFKLPDNAYLEGIPMRGTVGSIAGGWRYSWSQQTARAISTEDGRIFSLVGSFSSPYLGSYRLNEVGESEALTAMQLTSELREYVVNPLLKNHVLAVKLGAGATVSNNSFLGNYQVGGSIGDSAFNVTPDESHMLRGYPFGNKIGDLYWLTSAEYRFPLVYIEHGASVLPVYARNISASVFADAGNAFGAPEELSFSALQNSALDGAMVGVGAELSVRMVFAWRMFLTGRIGYGVGLTPGGYDPSVDPLAPLYFQLGSSF